MSGDNKRVGRLLVLDDDENVSTTIKRIAMLDGMSCQTTADPEEFFTLVSDWLPTHIALDLIMPDMDGVEVIRELSARGCRATVIISSGVGGRVLDAAARSAAELGLVIAGVLPKPFSPAQLRDLLRAEPSAERSGGPGAPGFVPDEQSLDAGLRERQFTVVYQPKIRCANGDLAGFEALVRWQHPEHGLLAPNLFIPMAESTGQINDLTRQIVDQALRWLSYRFPGGDTLMSVNISARSLDDDSFVEQVGDLCRQNGIGNNRIIFELTESSAMADPVASLARLTRLRMKGFQLSIDDFGTGFSSMMQLVRLPFSEIKVDKSFVMTAMKSQESRSVIQSIVGLGHSLGLQAVAEGVEDAATLAYLGEIGCDLAQGYFIARPMSGDSVLEWLEHRPAWSGG